jgi:hypothetical protein
MDQEGKIDEKNYDLLDKTILKLESRAIMHPKNM